MKDLKLTINLNKTDVFKEVLNIIKNTLDDKRVPREVKQEIKNKLNEIIKKEGK